MTIRCLLLALLLIRSLPAAVPHGALLFEDDFSGGLDKWVDGDKGKIVDGAYRLAGEPGVPHRVYTREGVNWTDYIVEFDVTVENGIASWLVRTDLTRGGALDARQSATRF